MLEMTLTLQIKLGSLIVHYEEWTSANGHPHDEIAINDLRNDPEVIEWMNSMKAQAFLPVKRSE